MDETSFGSADLLLEDYEPDPEEVYEPDWDEVDARYEQGRRNLAGRIADAAGVDSPVAEEKLATEIDPYDFEWEGDADGVEVVEGGPVWRAAVTRVRYFADGARKAVTVARRVRPQARARAPRFRRPTRRRASARSPGSADDPDLEPPSRPRPDTGALCRARGTS